MKTKYCPYANGINELDISGTCVIDCVRCYDIDNYKSCEFYLNKYIEDNGDER